MKIKELRKICQATAPAPENESMVGRFCRFFSIYFTTLFLRTNITPNQITVLSTIVFFIGLGLFFSKSQIINLFGSLIIIFSVVLDGCDGEVARFRKNTRLSGEAYTEPVSHDIQYGLMFAIIGIILWYKTGGVMFLFLGMAASIAKLLYRLLEIRYWLGFIQLYTSKKEIEEKKYSHKKRNFFIRSIYWINKNIFSSAGLVGPLFIFVLLKRLDLFLWLYALGFTVFYIILFIKQIYKISSQKL